MDGIALGIKDAWHTEENEDKSFTVFKDSVLEEKFYGTLNAFFLKAGRKCPDFSGELRDSISSMEVVTEDLVLKLNPETSIFRMPLLASAVECPVQFFVSSENVSTEIDDNLRFKPKDIYFVVAAENGFIVSMSYEEYGYFNSCMEDLIKLWKDSSYEEVARKLFKPSVQEKTFKAFGSFYSYLYDKNAVEESIYTF